MRIGIVGGGAAGLASAWLLEGEHAVTLFEQQPRLGGHAHTLDVEQGGERVGIDAGFEFFSARRFPTFTRLLGALDVPVRHYPLTATFYTVDQRYLCLLPPVRAGRLVWAGLRPRALLDLLQFGVALRRARPLMEARDDSLTVAQFAAGLPLLPAFKRDFLLPFLLAGWCLAPEEFQHFSAYDVLSYAYWHQPTGLTPAQWSEVTGGTQTYVQALARSLNRAAVYSGCDVVGLTRQDETYRLRTAEGAEHIFDHVILATNARVAGGLLAGVSGADDLCRALGRVEYFPTTIAVHGDPRFMPADRRFWSVVNTCYDGRYSANTVWKGWKGRTPLFRSWVTFAPRLPEPLYGLVTFEHPKVNAAYFEAQRSLAPVQGRHNLWLAGVYTHDIDAHESAILSAVNIARRLAPGAARLRQIAPQAAAATPPAASPRAAR